MNISSLIQGFSSYLESLNKLSEKDYNTNSSSVSIFMYSSEFKSYLLEELEISDSSIFSKSINDILSMDVVNGQLVENTDGNSDTFVLSDEVNEDYKKQTPNVNLENSTEQIQDDVALYENNLENENFDVNIAIENEAKPEETVVEKEVLTEILNNIFQDQAVISSLDTNESGDFDKNEIAIFLNDINQLDGDLNNLSINDVLVGIEELKEKVDLPTDIESGNEETFEAEEMAPSQNIQDSPNSTSNSSDNFSSGSTRNDSSSSSNGDKTVQEKSLDNMTREELNSELTTAKGELTEKQDILSSILNGSEENIQAMTEDMQNMYDAYLSELKTVDEDMAMQVDSLKVNIDDQEKLIDSKDQEIANQENIVAESENAYNNAVSNTQQLKASLSTLQSTDTSNMDDSKIAELNSKIAELQSKITESEQAEAEAEQTLNDAKDRLNTLNTERESYKTELDNLNQQMTELEANIVEAYPQVQESLNAYKETKQLRDSYKAEATSAIKSEINTAQNYVNEVNTAINNLNNEETSKEYSVSTLPVTDEELAEYGFDTEEKRDAWSHLVPEMQEAIVKLTDYAHSIGIEIKYNSKRSIFRTFEEQQEIYRTSRPGYAAKPGNSRHESGEAVDITIPNADKNNPNDKSYRALAEYWMDMGYTWGGNWNACEPWHFDLRPNK